MRPILTNERQRRDFAAFGFAQPFGQPEGELKRLTWKATVVALWGKRARGGRFEGFPAWRDADRDDTTVTNSRTACKPIKRWDFR